MADYLYIAKIWKDSSAVIGVDPVVEEERKVDFETNYKDSCYRITAVQLLNTVFSSTLEYEVFKTKVDGESVTWADVKIVEDAESYNLYILSPVAL